MSKLNFEEKGGLRKAPGESAEGGRGAEPASLVSRWLGACENAYFENSVKLPQNTVNWPV